MRARTSASAGDFGEVATLKDFVENKCKEGSKKCRYDDVVGMFGRECRIPNNCIVNGEGEGIVEIAGDCCPRSAI